MSCQIFYHEYALDSLPTIQPLWRIPQIETVRRRRTKNAPFYGEIRFRGPTRLKRAQCYPQFVIWTLGTLSQDERRNACTRPCPLLVQSVANDPKQAIVDERTMRERGRGPKERLGQFSSKRLCKLCHRVLQFHICFLVYLDWILSWLVKRGEENGASQKHFQAVTL